MHMIPGRRSSGIRRKREDARASGEQRLVTVGTDAAGRVVVIVYAHRGKGIRLISERAATRNETKAHEEGI